MPPVVPLGAGSPTGDPPGALSPQLAAWPTAPTWEGVPCGGSGPSFLGRPRCAPPSWPPTFPLCPSGTGHCPPGRGGGRCRTDVQVSASQSLAAGAPAPPTNHVPDINVGKEQSLLSCRFSHLLLRLLLPNTDTESDISKKSRCTLLTCPK